ncbi:MAG: hypothetical protein COB15_04820 [Flavobacteriales bacterium]|nr:MAG: hypothetical protein COB15_04820 [Flavobacteriales bacterium]
MIEIFRIKKIQFLLIWGLLLLSFNNNFFKTMDSQYHFDVFMDGTQSLVWGRIANSEQNGLFSDGMLMGRCYPTPKECNGNNSICAKRFQKKIFLNKYKIENYQVYKSHPAIHTLIFTLINTLLDYEPNVMVELFLFITALINAFIFAILIHLIFDKYGMFIKFFIAIALIFNFWFICYGNEMYMFFGFMFLPLIITWKIFSDINAGKEINNVQIFLYITLSVFLKYLFTGFEFISCSVLMIFIPIIYFGIDKKNYYKNVFLSGVLAGLAIVFGVIIALCVLCLQLWSLEGSFNEAFIHIFSRFMYRTAGESAIDPEKLKVLSVLKYYLQERAIDYNRNFQFSFEQLVWYYIISVASLSFFKKYKSLILASVVALLASISWLVIFRQHSVIHTHVDPIVWYMPFLFFAFAIIGLAIKELSLFFLRAYRSKRNLFIR